MGKTFKSIIRSLTNGSTSPTPGPLPGATSKPPRRTYVTTLTPEQRKVFRDKAHTALREGLTVFMSKDTVTGFARLLKTDSVTPRIMRRLLEEVATGGLVLTKSTEGKPTRTISTARVLPTVLSVDQLSAGMPFTLKQAARILNVDEAKLYYRCIIGKIHFERDRSRYYIPATEVERLRVIGL